MVLDSPDADGLLAIGAFARRTGLSVGALRHYASVGLLEPAYVNDATGYRYYTPEQADQARLIARLRLLDVPLATVRQLLAVAPEHWRDRLEAQHAVLEAEIWRLQRRAHWLRRLIDDPEEPMPQTPAITLDPDDERRLAAALFNRVWELLEQPGRSQDEDDEMLHAAHASRHHWGQVGQPVHRARSEWQCARVYAVLGRAEPALHHAHRCLELADAHQLGPFDSGCAHEALARAYRTAGDATAQARHLAAATSLADTIDDPEDRKILLDDLAQLT